MIRRLAANDYARAWTSLDPSQQLLVEQRDYVRCESLSAIPGRLDRIDVLDAHPERVVVPGSGGRRMRSNVITFRLTFARDLRRAPLWCAYARTLSVVTAAGPGCSPLSASRCIGQVSVALRLRICTRTSEALEQLRPPLASAPRSAGSSRAL